MADPAPPPREKRVVGTSLKMYFDLQRTKEYIESVAQLSDLATKSNIDLFVIPDFLSLVSAQTQLAHTDVWLGAQDTHDEDEGAFTGEISPLVLSQVGVRLVEIGHAERRRLFGETDDSVARKSAAVARNGMVPLVCIGEKTRGDPALAAKECEPQVRAALSLLPAETEVVLAYEPVWAIGASEPAEPEHVVAVTRLIREMVVGRKGRTRILYGGSAGPGTFERLKGGVDGLFLGRFAHDVGNLEKVIREMSEV